ncbi:hypothetical protein BDD43_4077 [Mucilaginibacter gracilis]|uniref:Outer membrane protein with beta-barrel domain n=1 Tax=Mucilaginibacter gracilis TaxID=423350 RepID=A0A495J5G6_9SPHI|nr:hypothetical protein [Mucilaginibacter gracilis]RKR83862.1 hypothetical protein BDD43_4077 [Mucilaginibacter gracilis]
MTKLTLVFISLFAFATAIKAQSTTYHAFKIDLGAGVDLLNDNAATFTFTIEPHYRLSDVFALGLRFQGAVNVSLKNNGGGVHAYSSDCLSGDYYVTDVKKTSMLFIGGGLGVFTQSDNNGDNQVDNFGFFPRVGVETSRFRGSLEYNVTGGLRNYFSINAGVYFGGRRR